MPARLPDRRCAGAVVLSDDHRTAPRGRGHITRSPRDPVAPSADDPNTASPDHPVIVSADHLVIRSLQYAETE
jgi:hypothetical protein